MMDDIKIIGGEFKIDSDALRHEIRQNTTPGYSLGRTCLYAICDAVKGDVCGGLLLPDYLCKSVAEVPFRIGMPVVHYHISSNFTPDVEDIRQKANGCSGRIGIVLISYFGLVDLNETIAYIRSEFPDMVIIVDDVQNFYGFGKHIDFDYCFTSYRKWFEVPDGADILQKRGTSKTERYLQQSEYALYKAAGNLLKNHTEIIGDSVSLELIGRGEELMDEKYLYSCSDISCKLLQRMDVESAAKKRKKNAECLHKGLERLNIQHLYDPEMVPLFIPVLISERDRIRKKLFADRIFTPVHWPLENIETQANNDLYRTELSLICDQRYDEEDMERILREIEDAM